MLRDVLKCPHCYRKYREFRYFCECGSVLLFEKQRLRWHPNDNGVWRYQNLLPTHKSISSNEGDTPLIRRRDVPEKVYLKFEGLNPTGSFKDRGSTVVLSHAKNMGYKKVGTASTGNMGASVAAYAAYGNLKAEVFVPKSTPKNKMVQIIAYDSILKTVDGTYTDCVKKLLHENHKQIYLAQTGVNPYFIEGEKTIGFEIFEEIGVPDAIVVPIGTGGLITAIYKAFKELKQMNKTKKLPQMIGVQAKQCCPVIDAWKNDSDCIEVMKKVPKTIASAIMVKTPLNGLTAIQAMNESKGFGVAVSERDIHAGIKELGKEGVFAEPASATTAAAMQEIEMETDEKVVLVITGHGLKQPM